MKVSRLGCYLAIKHIDSAHVQTEFHRRIFFRVEGAEFSLLSGACPPTVAGVINAFASKIKSFVVILSYSHITAPKYKCTNPSLFISLHNKIVWLVYFALLGKNIVNRCLFRLFGNGRGRIKPLVTMQRQCLVEFLVEN